MTIGSDAFVGEKTVIDIGSSLGDGAQLGHSSSLHSGQSVPAGEHRCGSPARQRIEKDYRDVPPGSCSVLKKCVYCTFVLLNGLIITAFLFAATAGLIETLAERVHFEELDELVDHWHPGFYVGALIISTALFSGSLLFGILSVITIPRLLNGAIKPDKVYPLYGFHYWISRAIERTSNVNYLVHLFGDSSYIVPYLRSIGYDLSNDVVQTGSNFGGALRHDNPFLVSIGRGTMVADGLSIASTDYSNTSFRTSRVMIGADNFLGNQIVYPADGKTGNNCLLATKVMVPIEGNIREGVGLLGSPCF